MASFGSLKSTIFDKEERKQQYQWHIRGLNAYDRHKKFINDYGLMDCKELNKFIVVYLNFNVANPNIARFIRSEEDDMNPSWEQRLVKRYYDKLFKEYCLADMSQYKSGKIGLRWRTEKEVMSGKGQFICGNKHCNEKDGLASYEVNFCYFEAGEDKQALVKLVTCERCACKLNYKRQKEKEHSEKIQQDQDRRKRNRSKSDDDVDDYQESKERRRKGLKLNCLYKLIVLSAHRYPSHPFFNILAKSYAPDLVAPVNAPVSIGSLHLWPKHIPFPSIHSECVMHRLLCLML
ncbi:hypothetical protein ACSQ67_024289 [Phaseolus vulgaris]